MWMSSNFKVQAHEVSLSKKKGKKLTNKTLKSNQKMKEEQVSPKSEWNISENFPRGKVIFVVKIVSSYTIAYVTNLSLP